MKYAFHTVLAGGCLLAVAACGGEATSADTDADGTITQAEVSAAVADIKMTPGEWENRVEFVDIEFDESQLPSEMRGMMAPILDQMRGTVNTVNDCVTPEEAEAPEASMFSGDDSADCDYERFTFSEGTIDMAMTCRGPDIGRATFTSAGTYTSETYNMDMTIQMVAAELGDMKISAKSTGKLIGECSE